MLGSEEFVEWVRAGEFSFSREHVGYETGVLRPRVSSVIREVAKVYKVSEEALFHSQKGRSNEARQVAMYLIRELCDTSLKEIARLFSLGSYGSPGGACSVIEGQIKGDTNLRLSLKKPSIGKSKLFWEFGAGD